MLFPTLHHQQRRQHERQHRQRDAGIAQRHHEAARIKQGKRQRREEGDCTALQTTAGAVFTLEQIGQIIKQSKRHAKERGGQREVGEQMHCQFNVRRRHDFAQCFQQSVQAGILRQQRGKRRGVNTAERRQLPENIGDQRDKATDDKDPTQLTNIAVKIADDARHATVKTERGKNHRDRR